MEGDTASNEHLVDEYENLRSCAMTGRVGMVRRGLTVLLQSGLASWMSVCRKTPRPKPVRPRAPGSRLREMPREQWSQIITLLADVAMQRFAETIP